MFTTKNKKAVVSVINDLVSDVRVFKTCAVLQDRGYDVTLIGRRLPGSPEIPDEWTFKAIRMHLQFKKGVAFYIFFNLRLFFRLLFTKADLLFANDLDTLAPNFLVSKLKGIPLIYDSHELFCEVPELMQSPFKKKIWETLERMILPGLKHTITVNESIASFYEKKYGCKMSVIRNIPPDIILQKLKTREELGLSQKKYVFILQGAGINIDRGAEELVKSMTFTKDALLLIIGSGDVWPQLEKQVKENGLSDKVKLIKRLPKQELMQYTINADIGISIDKGTNLNYHYSLPNKLFDYIQAGIPVLASRMSEIEKIVTEFQIGDFINTHSPEHIAAKLMEMAVSPKREEWKQNLMRAKNTLNWDTEQKVLINLVSSIKH